jgi:hypothetical protein
MKFLAMLTAFASCATLTPLQEASQEHNRSPFSNAERNAFYIGCIGQVQLDVASCRCIELEILKDKDVLFLDSLSHCKAKPGELELPTATPSPEVAI